jgi:hypothetical protein
VFFLPGWLVSIVTFPGVIVHEVAHRFFCDLAGVPVYKVCYFRAGNPAGYVLHEKTTKLGATFLITVGPLLVNTVLCSFLTFTPMIAVSLSPEYLHPVFYLLMWVGFSVGMHAFPSNQDAGNFIDALDDAGRHGLLYWVSQGFRGLIFIANLLRIVWFDFLYALVVAWLLPHLLFHSIGFADF